MVQLLRIASRACLPAVLLVLWAAPAEAKSYSADRFDSRARVLPGGGLEVTETLVLRFESGTFSQVFREIPRRRTDGIEIVRATMDEREMPFGSGPGFVEVRGRGKLRVRWMFPTPVAESTHTFTLTYRMAGVVRQDEAGDRLDWRALPSEHAYTIRESSIEIEHPVALAGPAGYRLNRVGDIDATSEGTTTSFAASSIRKNGWIQASLLFPAGSIISAPPQWQQTQLRAEALAPRWGIAAGVAFAAGLLLLWSMRQRYDTPQRGPSLSATVLSAPDELRPAIGGTLASNGRPSLEHAMAAVFGLADRGELTITEEPKGMFGQRSFVLEQRPTGRPLARHEQALLTEIFAPKGQQENSVTLAKARSRIASGFSRFRSELYQEMAAAGLLDPDRRAVHARLGAVSLAMVVLGSALFIGAAFLVAEYRGWPLLVPGAVILVGLTGFITQGATTPLSNEGVRRGERWRGYKDHLREVARHQAHLASESPIHVLPYAIALGLAASWSQLLKAHPALVPAWFNAVEASRDHDAFPAFVAAGGASSSGGAGGGGAGGAAGGGGSGAS